MKKIDRVTLGQAIIRAFLDTDYHTVSWSYEPAICQPEEVAYWAVEIWKDILKVGSVFIFNTHIEIAFRLDLGMDIFKIRSVLDKEINIEQKKEKEDE